MVDLLRVRNLTRRFGGITAVDDFSFDVDKGEMIGIVGPNGAGKTTLFNLISGFLRPDSGSVLFKGAAITDLEPHRISLLGLSRTFQQVRYFQGLNVFETVAIPLLLRRRNDRQRIAQALEAVGLKGKENVIASSLTYVEQKSLEIARAIISAPDLLLLDEPFGGLTPDEMNGIVRILRVLQEEGRTTIIIEHRLAELIALVKRLMVMDFGKKIADGSPKEVLKEEKVIEAYLGRSELASDARN